LKKSVQKPIAKSRNPKRSTDKKFPAFWGESEKRVLYT
jgi:hypothetical protein